MAKTLGPWLGMQEKPHPSYLKEEWLQYAIDVDFSRNTIAPLRSDRKLSDQTGNTIYQGDCCLKVYPSCVQIATNPFDCKQVFGSGFTGINYPVTATPNNWCADKYCRMGWPCNFEKPTITYNSSTVSDREAEGRSYVYTYINEFGQESQPSNPSEMEIHDFSVPATITGFGSIDASFCPKYVKIYALVAGMSSTVGGGSEGNDEYLCVATLPYGQLMFTHDPLAQPFGDALTTDEFVPVPDDANDFWHYGTNQLVFQSQGGVRFTEPWNYSLAPLKYTYKPKAQLLRIAATQQFIYMLTCSQVETLSSKGACDMSGLRESSVTNDNFPLIGRQSVATYENSVIFASVLGLVQVTGFNAKVITEDCFTQAQWDALQPQTMRGTYHDGYYYCASDMACFRIEMAGGGKSGYAEKMSYLSIRPTAFFVTADGRLLYSDATGTHEMGQGSGFKSYKATTKEFYEPNQGTYSVMRVRSEHGNISITRTIINNCGDTKDTVRNISCGGIMRWKKKLGAGVKYSVQGSTEISSIHLGHSISGLTGRG